MIKKQFFAIFLLFLFVNNAFAWGCHKVYCGGNIKSGEESSKNSIEQAYAKLYANLDELRKQYEKQLEQITEQNKLLKQRKALMQKDLMDTKEIIFLLKKFNSLQNNINTLEAY
ncbi:hypothetical protein [Campylobacter sp. US33a]|uniref:hypothetical protein n=1 Tax=Campylobacter sp. US33a TaxID=2498120 RepID=UPI001068D14D|nr:hypothetical protein [Campylobacter sp. US33a]TEY00725.1 hypothetical protein ELQ16_08810 [Campylobacter sp. US33a]